MRSLTGLLKLAVVAGIFYFLIRSGGLQYERLLRLERPVRYLSWALFFLVSYTFVALLRWMILLRIQGINSGFFYLLRIYWTSSFLGLIVPGSAGMDVIRAYYVIRDYPGKRVVALSTVLFDRIIGLSALLCVGAVAGLSFLPKITATPGLLRIWILSCLLAAGSILVIVLLALKPIRDMIARWEGLPLRGHILNIQQAVAENTRQPKRVALAFVISAVTGILNVAALVACARALSESVSIARALFVCPLAFTINSLPLTPSGLGVGESALQYLFRLLGYDVGAESMLLMRAVIVISVLPGLFLFVAGKSKPAQVDPSTTQDV